MARRRVEINPALLERINTVDVVAANSEATQPQICRTCTHTSDHDWLYTGTRREQMLASGYTEDELLCAPDRHADTLKVLEQTDWRGRIVSADKDCETRTSAYVETCGQDIARKCFGCDRFIAHQTPVPYARSGAEIHWRVDNVNGSDVAVPYAADGSSVSFWNVKVGGYCSIPAEGITVNGVVKYCDRIERGRDIEPSCSNCKWLYRTGDHWMGDHLEVNRNASLTPWERERARRSAALDMSEAQAIGIALWRKQTESHGRVAWFRAWLMKAGMHNGIMKYKIKMWDSGITAVVAADDDRWRVHITDEIAARISEGTVVFDEDAPYVAVEVRAPHHKALGLTMPLRSIHWVWPEFPKSQFVDRAKANHAVADCVRCTDRRPCYFHSKRPKKNLLTGEIDFQRPRGNVAFWRMPPHARLSIVRIGERYYAVDGNNALPVTYGEDTANITVFRHWYPSLMATAREIGGSAPADIANQYMKLLKGLVPDPDTWRKLRPSWLAPSSVEPSKPHCSHPYGLDLRKVFGDSFGLERVEFDFDFGAANTMRVEEEVRVGYRQHEHTPQRLQEEELATIRSHPNYNPHLDEVVHPDVAMPQDWHVTKVEAVGDMTCNGDPVTSTAEFLDLLDDEVVAGYHGESPRMVSRRQQMFGYQMSRGFYGRRSGSDKTIMPSAENEMAIFDWDDEPDEAHIDDAWACPDCKTIYSHSDINFGDPRCECGSALLFLNRTQPTHNPRAGGGVGSAVVMDTEYMMERKRLYASLCPHWELAGSRTRIGLDKVAGPSVETPVLLTAKRAEESEERVKIYKVGKLTDEQRATNVEYRKRMEAVLAQRVAHQEEHPSTTPEELQRLYPTPTGTIYEEKIAGSLAKMGGV